MRIDINEKMISPWADRKDAERLMLELAVLDWPVQYERHDPVWQFDSHQQMIDFEEANRVIKERLWPIHSPRIRMEG